MERTGTMAATHTHCISTGSWSSTRVHLTYAILCAACDAGCRTCEQSLNGKDLPRDLHEKLETIGEECRLLGRRQAVMPLLDCQRATGRAIVVSHAWQSQTHMYVYASLDYSPTWMDTMMTWPLPARPLTQHCCYSSCVELLAIC